MNRLITLPFPLEGARHRPAPSDRIAAAKASGVTGRGAGSGDVAVVALMIDPDTCGACSSPPAVVRGSAPAGGKKAPSRSSPPFEDMGLTAPSSAKHVCDAVPEGIGSAWTTEFRGLIRVA
jgi:hypothetical protein